VAIKRVLIVHPSKKLSQELTHIRTFYCSFHLNTLISSTDFLVMPNSMKILLQNLPPNSHVHHNDIYIFGYNSKYKPPITTKFISVILLATCFGFSEKPS